MKPLDLIKHVLLDWKTVGIWDGNLNHIRGARVLHVKRGDPQENEEELAATHLKDAVRRGISLRKLVLLKFEIDKKSPTMNVHMNSYLQSSLSPIEVSYSSQWGIMSESLFKSFLYSRYWIISPQFLQSGSRPTPASKVTLDDIMPLNYYLQALKEGWYGPNFETCWDWRLDAPSRKVTSFKRIKNQLISDKAKLPSKAIKGFIPGTPNLKPLKR